MDEPDVLPSRAATRFLRVFCLVVDAVPCQPSKPGAVVHGDICRFLLSLYMIDVLAWVIYKVIQFEALQTATGAYEAGDGSFTLSPVLFVTVLTTLETTIEIGTSAAVPLVFYWVEGVRELHPARLAAFCMKIYTASTLCALVISLIFAPCIVGGAVDEIGQQMEECEAGSCRCVAAPPSAPLLPGAGAGVCELEWMSANGTTAACCLRGGVEVELCAVATDSACPLTPAALAIVLTTVYCVFYCCMNQVREPRPASQAAHQLPSSPAHHVPSSPLPSHLRLPRRGTPRLCAHGPVPATSPARAPPAGSSATRRARWR